MQNRYSTPSILVRAAFFNFTGDPIRFPRFRVHNATHQSACAPRVTHSSCLDNVVIIKRKLTITRGGAAETDGEAMD
jgi:hypothetical protein